VLLSFYDSKPKCPIGLCISDWTVFLSVSDHLPIFFTFDTTVSDSLYNNTNLESRKFNSVNKSSFSDELAETLVSEFCFTPSFSTSLDNFNDCILSCVNNHAPIQKCKIKFKRRPPWLDQEYVTQRAIRRQFEKRFRITQLSSDKEKFRSQRTYCNKLATKKRHDYYSSTIQSCNGDQKALFRFVKRILGNDSSKQYPVMIDENSNILIDVDMANQFNSYFTKKIHNIRQTMPMTSYNTSLSQSALSNCGPLSHFSSCSEQEISKLLKATGGCKSSFSDILPSNLLSYCCDDLVPYLTYLVNLSLSTGSFENLKEAYITPTHKNSSKPNPMDNYRPVSDLSFISKLIERVVLARINEHLTENNLLNPNQFGYKKQHSCESLLTLFTNDLFCNIENGKATVVVMCDLSAAFDTVDHQKLLSILEKTFFISGTSLQWFKSFLSSRTQKVVIRGSVSDPKDVIYGVPQGSVLAPVLFNLYTHTLPDVFLSSHFKCLSYADDTTGYLSFTIDSQSSIGSYVDECLLNVKQWMGNHYLKLNPSKTQIIIFGNRHLQKQISIMQIPLSNYSSTGTIDENLPILDNVKYLGVQLDSTLSLNHHINSVCSQCYFNLRKISSIRRFISQQDCEKLVHAVISSRLDYCNFMFFGLPKFLLQKLQRIQNSAVRLILEKSKRDSISECYNILHWLKIEERSVFKLLMTVYKCLHCEGAPTLLCNLLIPATTSRNSSHMLQITFNKTSLGRRAFSYTAPRLWNSLPSSIRSSPSLPVFKSKLKTFLFTSFPTLKAEYCRYSLIVR
jgi:hypothetical protein